MSSTDGKHEIVDYQVDHVWVESCKGGEDFPVYDTAFMGGGQCPDCGKKFKVSIVHEATLEPVDD